MLFFSRLGPAFGARLSDLSHIAVIQGVELVQIFLCQRFRGRGVEGQGVYWTAFLPNPEVQMRSGRRASS